MCKNNKRERIYVCVLVIEDDYRAEINFDLRNEFTYLEVWPNSMHYDLIKYYFKIDALATILLKTFFKDK